MRIAMIPSQSSTSSSTMVIVPPLPLPPSTLPASFSNEKLNELIMADQNFNEDLSPSSSSSSSSSLSSISRSGSASILQAIIYWLDTTTEQHRKQFSIQMKKNWLRLLISLTVVCIQFLWFASYYIGLNSYSSSSSSTMIDANHLAIESGHQPSSVKTSTVNNDVKNLIPSPSSSSSSISSSSSSTSSLIIDSVIINMTNSVTTSSKKIKEQRNKLNPNQMMIPSCQLFGIESKLQTLIKQQQNLQQEPWPSFIWRMILGLKLALIMIGLELLRLFDTIWEVFRNKTTNKTTDDKNRRKSFIDLSYIERNRGYK